MEWLTILKAVLVALGTFVGTGVPLIIKLVSAHKQAKAAKTEAEAQKAYNDMLTTAQSLIGAAEVAFDGFDKVMKAQGSSAAAMKKDNVLSKLQAYALSNGYEFDAVYWSDKIDEIVKFTREVNAHPATNATSASTASASGVVSTAAAPTPTIHKY